MRLLGDSSKFHIAGTGLHCPWLPSAPLGAGVMIISCGSHSPPVLAEPALQSLPLSSIPGCRIIVIIFRGGKKPLVHTASSQVFARFSPSYQEFSRCFCPVQAPSVQTETLVSKVWPGRGCSSCSQPAFPTMASFWGWRAASFSISDVLKPPHPYLPLHPAPPS